MIVRTSRAREFSFELLEDKMIENDPKFPYSLLRVDLKYALQRYAVNPGSKVTEVAYSFYIVFGVVNEAAKLTQGKTQRGKKYIQIGCKRFVGVNRTRLIKWAKSAKAGT